MTRPKVLILACGALARELQTLLRVNGLTNVTVEYLSASLHNRPEHICGLLRQRLTNVRHSFDRVLLGYADCGTSGEIDLVCAEFDAERLPGSHCYDFYLAPGRFDALQEEEPGTFYLTDYLATHFDRLIFDGLGIERHPELFELYFANYERVVYLAQTGTGKTMAAAVSAAGRLGLPLTTIDAGWGQLGDRVAQLSTSKWSPAEAPSMSVAISK